MIPFASVHGPLDFINTEVANSACYATNMTYFAKNTSLSVFIAVFVFSFFRLEPSISFRQLRLN